MPDPEDVARGYESSDLAVRGGIRVLAVIVIGTAIVFAVTTAMQYFWVGRFLDVSPPETGVAEEVEGPVPRDVQSRARSGTEYNILRASELELLNSYGWVNEDDGVVHIPIDVAMDMLLEEGFPTRPEDEQEQFIDQGLDIPLDSSSGRVLERMTDP
jgi:hypothetical protein